jgi:hypothetical protein
MKRPVALLPVLAVLVLLCVGCPNPDQGFVDATFTVMSDMRHYLGSTEFLATARAVAEAGPGQFIVSPGDIDPPQDVLDVIHGLIDPGITWYTVVGNHEAETTEDMAWLRSYIPTLPGITLGPPGSADTCYSFDYGIAHYVILNEYFMNGMDHDPTGDVSPELLAWLEDDLAATAQPVILVFGHEPAFPQPDTEPPHTINHEGDSLDADPAHRDAFWQVLVDNGVLAYFCGHTHTHSMVKIDGVWQVDGGHAAGTAYPDSRSTFMRFKVSDSGEVAFEVWRMEEGSTTYSIADQGWL